MKAQELKEKLFGEFLKWLDKSGIGDHFSMDVWMTKCWEKLFGMYMDDVRNSELFTTNLKKLPLNVLKEFCDAKEKQENEIKEKQKGNIVDINSAKKDVIN